MPLQDIVDLAEGEGLGILLEEAADELVSHGQELRKSDILQDVASPKKEEPKLKKEDVCE